MSADGTFERSSRPICDQIFGRDRQRDEVADRLVEAVVGAVQIEVGLLVVGALVVIVAELVVDGDEVVGIDLGAHLDAQVVLVVDVPGRGVADRPRGRAGG